MKSNHLKSVLFLVLVLAIPFAGIAQEKKTQRRINPVRNAATVTQTRNESKKDSVDFSKLQHFHDENGNIVYVDSVTGKEIVDSTAMQKVPPMKYPLFHSASLSVDLWSPVMRAFGTKYGLIGFAAQVNLHNRYIPTFEFGLGKADYTPADNNYTYRSPISPYFKIGADYNFLYNSNPDYMVYVGMRYGFTSFKFNVANVDVDDSYWGESQTVDFPSQTSTSGYFELLFGLKVQLWKNWAMGWNLRYHKLLHQSAKEYGKPYYIPGFGSRASNVAVGFSLYYTLSLDKYNKKKKKAEQIISGPIAQPIVPINAGEGSYTEEMK